MDAVPQQGLGCPEIWWGVGKGAQGRVAGIWSAHMHRCGSLFIFQGCSHQC